MTCGLSRRAISMAGGFAMIQLIFGGRSKAAETTSEKFDFLSTHGNSSCTKEFLDSIAAMAPGARLQGSCCSPMESAGYAKQVAGLKKYQAIADIPPDPYDIDAALAQKLLTHYDLALRTDEQKAYDYAMANSNEKGPCCCRCWRWKVYGGLAKVLIREHRFAGKQVTEIWNLSDGCGGGAS
ncbi:MAG TPA: hypothetical protein VMZ01_06760 [Aestuariivirga sp.]|nr:hypothetical protein [Aestuariivirga sp.]